MNKLMLLFLIFVSAVYGQQSKLSYNLQTKLSQVSETRELKIWIYFTDKTNKENIYFDNPETVVSKKSLIRRIKVIHKSSLLDFNDIPVNKNYIESISSIGIKIHQRSRWFNAVSAYAKIEDIYRVENYPFIKKIELVKSYRVNKESKPSQSNRTISGNIFKTSSPDTSIFDYGDSFAQLEQINVPAVHNLGFHGQGITICLMDAGFNNLEHEVFKNTKIIATHDFVNNDNNVDDEGDLGSGNHGTETLSTIAGFKEGKLIGTAFDASFILAKTENTESETPVEEDNWIAAMEWADSIGVDVTSTSLGYLDMDPGFSGYTWEDMDGNTAKITKAADLAVARGIVVVNSAGNEGFSSLHNTINAPADGDSVIAVGAVDSLGMRVGFSSVGPTVDGRIKPDVSARGSGVIVASPVSVNGYLSAGGTSFSCPLAAGVAALILCANPNLTPMQVRDALRETASQNSAPDNKLGWGILDAVAAVNYFSVKIIIPEFLALQQNFPNPFNPKTIINYSIPPVGNDASITQHVSLIVYDILGRKISTLVNTEQAARNYSVEFNSKTKNGTLASGIYIYKLTVVNSAGVFASAKKMVLLK